MPAIGTTQGASYTLRDKTGEPTTHKLFTGDITAVSLPGFLTNLAAYETALDNIILGVRAKQSWGADTVVSNALPSDNGAQREMKLLVQFQDAVTEEPFTLTIGTIDPSVLNFVPNGGDAVIFEGAGASAEIVAWVTAFEALEKSPRNELNAVVVTGMKFVGRNS